MEKERHTARAIILNPENEILLLSVNLPWLDGATWMLPGGGIEGNESAEQCARREIFEETGYRHEGALTLHWHGTTEFIYQGDLHKVHERYFLMRVTETFTPTMAEMMDYERDFTLDIAWCNFQQLSQPKVHCSPKQIPRMLKQIESNALSSDPDQIFDVMPANYIEIS